MSFSIRSANFHMRRPRSLADILRHAPERSSKALRAAATARSTSAEVASATCVRTSPVAGFTVSKVFEPSSHCPSINRRPGLSFTLLAAIMLDGSPKHVDEPKLVHSRPLLRFKHRWTLVDVCRQAFLGIFALEEQLLVL